MRGVRGRDCVKFGPRTTSTWSLRHIPGSTTRSPRPFACWFQPQMKERAYNELVHSRIRMSKVSSASVTGSCVVLLSKNTLGMANTLDATLYSMNICTIDNRMTALGADVREQNSIAGHKSIVESDLFENNQLMIWIHNVRFHHGPMDRCCRRQATWPVAYVVRVGVLEYILCSITRSYIPIVVYELMLWKNDAQNWQHKQPHHSNVFRQSSVCNMKLSRGCSLVRFTTALCCVGLLLLGEWLLSLLLTSCSLQDSRPSFW